MERAMPSLTPMASATSRAPRDLPPTAARALAYIPDILSTAMSPSRENAPLASSIPRVRRALWPEPLHIDLTRASSSP